MGAIRRRLLLLLVRGVPVNGLAFDLGTTTGWAALMNGTVLSGVLKLKGGRFEGGGMRFLRFDGQVAELIDRVKPSWIYYEEVRRHRGTDAAHVYGGLMATLTALCEVRKVPYDAVPVGTIKKFWTGSGNADKGRMVNEAIRRGFKPEDDNEADALALLHWKLDELLN